MSRDVVCGFAQLLVRLVRDTSIRVSDRDLAADAPSPVALRWRLVAGGNSDLALAREMIPDIVDETIFELLHAIDSGELPLAIRDADGNWVARSDVGRSELAGWFMGPDGWRQRFSNERFADDIS